MRFIFPAVAVAILALSAARAAEIQQLFHYTSTITSDDAGPLDLRAELNYDDARANAPIAVVMHGYSPATGNFGNVRGNAERLRDAGFFVVSVAMRGRDGSDGVRDSGGLEIYDIYDAVEAVKGAFPTQVDETNIHITGYSGGGGNVMSALTKFPDYFRAGSSFFGMSDYGYDPDAGWYTAGAGSNHQSQLRTDVGNPTLGDPDVEDRYHARASSLAARNNPYSEIHLFVNANEAVCPPIRIARYRDNAVAAASEAGQFDNIRVHIAPTPRLLYEDFNDNGQNEPNERQWWPHGSPSADEQEAGELWYRQRLLDGSIPAPVLNASDELFVAGFVKTAKFEFWIGDGQNGAGLLDYSLTEAQKRFELSLQSNNLELGSKLTIDTADMQGKQVDVVLNNLLIETINIGGQYETDQLGHGDTLLLRLAMPGDYDKNGMIDTADFLVWKQAFGTTGVHLADGNEDGVVDSADFTLWRNNLQSTLPGLAQGVAAVPEPWGRATAVGLAVSLLVTLKPRTLLSRR